mgnify:CR=1 FL=1
MTYTKDDFYKAIVLRAMTQGYQGNDNDVGVRDLSQDLSVVSLINSHPHIYDRLLEDYREDLMYIKEWGV